MKKKKSLSRITPIGEFHECLLENSHHSLIRVIRDEE